MIIFFNNIFLILGGRIKNDDFSFFSKVKNNIKENENILKDLGIESKIPAYGWVFSEDFGKKNKSLINSFLNASNEAKKIMLSSDNEWERIFPLTNAKDRTTLIHLRDAYRNGIPLTFGNNEIEETKKIYKILAKYGGRDLIGKENEIFKIAKKDKKISRTGSRKTTNTIRTSE